MYSSFYYWGFKEDKMKKLKNFQRILGVLLTGLIGLNVVGFTATAEDESVWGATDNGELISYTGTETDVALPTTINGVSMLIVSGYVFNNNSLITSVTIPEGYTTLSGATFRDCTSLKSIVLPQTLINFSGNYMFRGCTSLESINIPSGFTGEIKARYFQDCSNPNLVIDIQSPAISSISSNSFLNVTGTIKTYTQSVYDLVKANATTANVVLIEDNTTALKDAIGDAAAYKEDNYTIDSYKVLTDAVTTGNTLIENGDASSTEIDNAIEAINNAIKGLVKRDFIEFDKVMAEAEDILNNHSYEYTSESISFLRGTVSSAKAYKESVTGEITEYVQSQINTHTSYMSARINLLVPLDKTEVFNELQQTITTAESYGSKDFTEESYAELAKALESAKALTEESSFKDLALAKQAIDTAKQHHQKRIPKARREQRAMPTQEPAERQTPTPEQHQQRQRE